MSRTIVWVAKLPGRSLALQWRDPITGVRHTRATKTLDSAAAETMRGDLEYELNHGSRPGQAALSWKSFREAFLDEYAAGLRVSTQEKFESVFDVFEQICKPTSLCRIDERTLSRFVAGMRKRESRGKVGLEPVTQKNYLVALKSALSWACKQRMIPICPQFPSIKVPKRSPQPIAEKDCERLLSVADHEWRAYLLCGWWAGLRLSEAKSLRRSRSKNHAWLDLEEGRIVLPATVAKSCEDQWVPLHAALRKAIEPLDTPTDCVFPNIEPLSRHAVVARIGRLAKRAGVNLSMHRLRKGFGCRVAKQLGKGDAPILHRLMRHSSMQVTMSYYASVDDALHDRMSQLK